MILTSENNIYKYWTELCDTYYNLWKENCKMYYNFFIKGVLKNDEEKRY